MNSAEIYEPGRALFDSLHGLEAATRVLARDVNQGFSGPGALLGDLEKAINGLGLKPASTPKPRPEYVQQWQEFLAGQRQYLESRTVRYLCWESDIATNEQFQDYLDREDVSLSARSLQGLVRSCHACWSPIFAASPVVELVRRRLEGYGGPNRLLVKWRDNLQVVLGTQGPERLAARIVEDRQSIKDCCEAWKIEGQSAYLQEVVRLATGFCQDQVRSDAAMGQYFLSELLSWQGWALEKFKHEISETILSSAMERQDFKEAFQRFVLGDDRLRDPRLPRNRTNWLGVSEDACLRFMQWLEREYIEFFFEHALPPGHDPHGRKPFWLRYVNQVRMSRPLLSTDDEYRLQRQIREKNLLFGRITKTTSAFLLDFGPILVIEFSKPGNACYVYERRAADELIPDFWSIRRFTFERLKQERVCVARIVHRPGWQEEMRRVLAHYGIRQG